MSPFSRTSERGARVRRVTLERVDKGVLTFGTGGPPGGVCGRTHIYSGNVGRDTLDKDKVES